MRVRALAAALLIAFASPDAAAAPGRPPEAEDSPARRHFKLGVALYQAGDFTAALAEFEGSFRDQPSPAALQNMALCLTKLRRYVQALETLEKLKAEYGPTLAAEDHAAVDSSMRQLAQLVGKVSISVTPADAQVTLNGSPLSPEALAKPVRVSSGEYRIRAEAPMHRAEERVITVAGGDEATVSIVLHPDFADVTVLASDRDAGIAIDGRAIAYGAWAGSLPSGTHLVQVYKSGYVPFASQIPLAGGDKLELRPALGPWIGEPGQEPQSMPPVDPRLKPLRPPRGWYGLVSANTLAVARHPDKFKASGDVENAGASFGVRVGYRFWDFVAFEGMIDAGGQTIRGEYTASGQVTSGASYDLSTERFGGNVRFLWGGRVARLSGVFGAGAVRHKVELPSATGEGNNSYFMLELGAQFNVGKVLLEGVALGFLEGADRVKSGGSRLYTEHSLVPQLGIGVRAGIGEWGQW